MRVSVGSRSYVIRSLRQDVLRKCIRTTCSTGIDVFVILHALDLCERGDREVVCAFNEC